MNILISNDDGIHSPGLQLLADGLEKLGAKVTVVAPQIERSAAGHSLTLHKPLRMKEVSANRYFVSGSPADCVYMATRHLLKEKPDLIVSGVNYGANLGQDHFYSGTVAAAREASFFGIKSLALSLCIHVGDKNNLLWQTAVDFAIQFVPKFHESSFPFTHVLNVNIPNLPPKQIKGTKFAFQGKRIYSDEVVECQDPRGRSYYWIGGNQKGHDNLPGSDCDYVADGYIAMVPLKSNCTDYDLSREHKSWEGLRF